MWRQAPTSNPNIHQLYKFKVLVPTYPPEDALVDDEGRKWCKQEGSVHEFFEWDGEYWFVWFKKTRTTQPEVPKEGDVVFDKTIKKVYQYRNLKRAIVLFEKSIN